MSSALDLNPWRRTKETKEARQKKAIELSAAAEQRPRKKTTTKHRRTGCACCGRAKDGHPSFSAECSQGNHCSYCRHQN